MFDGQSISFNEKCFIWNTSCTSSTDFFLELEDNGAKKAESIEAEEYFFYYGLDEVRSKGEYLFAFIQNELNANFVYEIHGNGIRDFGCYGRLCKVIVHKNSELNHHEEICIYHLFLDYRKPIYAVKYKVLDSFGKTELEAFQNKCMQGATNLYCFGIRYTSAVFQYETFSDYFVDEIDRSKIGIVVSKVDSTINELGCSCTIFSSEFDKRWNFDKDDLLSLQKSYFNYPLPVNEVEIDDDFCEI